MEINHLSTLYPSDPRVYCACSEIVDILLMARHVMDVNRMLIERNVQYEYGSLPGHFHRAFRNGYFTVWQRTGYNHNTCFPRRTLAVRFETIAARDKEIDNISLN